MTDPTTIPLDALAPDPASANADAADIIGYMLATADAGDTPDDVLATINVTDLAALLLSALKVGGSIVRAVPEARQFVLALASELRDGGEL